MLIADGDDLVRTALARTFTDEGYAVAEARTGTEAVEAARTDRPDVVVLDVDLPELSGLDVIRSLRKDMSCPILVVSARNEESDRLIGLYVGADDYIGKPCSIREVVARVTAQLRRVDALTGVIRTPHVTEVAGVLLDHDARRAFVDGVEVGLAAREFDLLGFLLRHPGSIHSPETLLREVWGEAYAGKRGTLRVHIYCLRRKLATCPTAPIRITTVPEAGYRMGSPDRRGKGAPASREPRLRRPPAPRAAVTADHEVFGLDPPAWTDL